MFPLAHTKSTSNIWLGLAVLISPESDVHSYFKKKSSVKISLSRQEPAEWQPCLKSDFLFVMDKQLKNNNKKPVH